MVKVAEIKCLYADMHIHHADGAIFMATKPYSKHAIDFAKLANIQLLTVIPPKEKNPLSFWRALLKFLRWLFN